MLDVLRFWFERGIDGFRVDAIHHLFEHENLRDNPPNPDWREGLSPARRVLRLHTMDQPEVHDAIAAMRTVADTYPGERLMIGEAYLPIDRLMAYYGVDLTGFHLPFNFHLIASAWRPQAIASLIEEYEAALPPGGWPNWVLGNHDRSRVASRIGPAQARVAAMLLLSLRGTPTIYQGEELGLTDAPIPPEKVQDPWEKNVPGLGLGRDPVRTPMPWNGGPQAGFTAGEPWLPIPSEHRANNAEAQAADPFSMLNLYRRLSALRGAEPALAVGSFRLLSADQRILAYERQDEERRLRVALNLSPEPAEWEIGAEGGSVLLSTGLDREGEDLGSVVRLEPNEGLIIAAR
jgi:alpha-glucosidase